MSQPPAPGWWLASDGNWYPPQPPAPVAPVAPRSNKGCLIVLAIVGTLFVVAGVIGAVVLWKVADTVKDVADGVTVGDVKCPSEGKVSDLVGHRVDLVMSGSLLVASGCNYTSPEDGAGAGVSIVSGSGLIGDEVLADLGTEAQSQGTETSSIDVGEDGLAFGSPMRSEAATRTSGHVVQVEVFAEGTDQIGDKRDAAVEILRIFLDLNY